MGRPRALSRSSQAGSRLSRCPQLERSTFSHRLVGCGSSVRGIAPKRSCFGAGFRVPGLTFPTPLELHPLEVHSVRDQPVTAPRESVLAHDADEPAVEVGADAGRVLRSVEVDGDSPCVMTETMARTRAYEA